MYEKYDLHCHSTHSDGDLGVNDLFQYAADQQVTHLALTDHDTLSGLAEAASAAIKTGVQLVTGLELSATWRGQLLHIVGLGVDPQNTTLINGVRQNQQRRFDRADRMLADFRRRDIDLTHELTGLLQGAVPTRPHFAQALINKGYARDKHQAFKRYLVPGKPGFVALSWPSIEEIADWVHAAGGIAVLAHPMRYKLTRSKLIALIKEMKAVNMRALEISTPVNDDQQIAMLARLAVEHDMLGSMGSDFHSNEQPWARLGSAKPLPPSVTPVWSELH